jgi:hypothetical protein
MKKSYLNLLTKKGFTFCFVLLLIGGSKIFSQTTIGNFYFTSSTASLPISADATATNITASLSGTDANAGYSGTATGASAFTSYATANYAASMAASNGTNTKWWILTVAGSDLNNYGTYKLYAQFQRSTTGAQTVTLLYSVDGSTYTSTGITATPADGSYTEKVFDLSSITARYITHG